MRTMLRLIKLASIYRLQMAIAAFLGFLTIGSSIGLLMSSAYIIATAALHPSIAELQVAIVGVRFFGISRGVFRYLERYTSHQVTLRILERLRVWFYKAIESLPPTRLYSFDRGDLLSGVVSDIEQLEHVYVRVLAPPLVAIGTAALMTVLLYPYGLPFPGLLFAAFFMGGIVIPIVTHLKGRKSARQIGRLELEMQQSVVNFLQGMSELFLSGRGEHFLNHSIKTGKELLQAQKKQSIVQYWQESSQTVLMTLTLCALLLVAIPRVNAGAISGVSMTVIILGFLAASEAVAPLPLAAQRLIQSHRAGKRLFRILDSSSNSTQSPGQSPIAMETIQIENLSFHYSSQAIPVLKQISFEISQGEKIAIVGHSGSGKSTLLSLLLGLTKPTSGNITLNGVRQETLDPEQWLSQFSVLPQKPFLFNDTILNNLKLANPNLAEEKIWQLAEDVALEDWLRSLPDGLNTMVGELGQRVSGGQKQRLALIRALLKDAPILVLDEPTAHLDPILEQQTINAVLKHSAGKTLILVSHKFVGLEAMDHILVLSKGELVEQGTLEQLLAINGMFARLYDIEQQKNALEAEI